MKQRIAVWLSLVLPLIILIAWVRAGDITITDTVVSQPLKYSFSWRLAPSWLTIAREPDYDYPNEWHPSFTHIEVDKAYKPILKLHEDGSYEILFETNMGNTDLPKRN